jgi:Tfp pilus assembly protein PilF
MVRNGIAQILLVGVFLGVAEEKTGHRDKARTEYQTAIAANPKNEDAMKALASLKNN